MSDRRPPEDPWSEVLDQVEEALADAGISDEPDRAALLDGVRSALDSLVGMDTRDGAGPDVVVVEGGRGQDEPPTEGAAPPLRVADPADGAEAREASWPDDSWEGAPEGPQSWTEVDGPPWTQDWSEAPEAWGGAPRVVVRVPADGARGPFPKLAGQGRFALSSGSPAQCLFVGPVPRAYRVACAEGALVVCVDGGMDLAVQSGCSVDVEARQVTVRAGGDVDTCGRYVRLDLEHV